MCTDRTLKQHINKYAELAAKISELEKLKKIESDYIMEEMETRQTDTFQKLKIVTERLTESVTKKGKEELKKLYPDEIENYINVSYSKYVNTANAKKLAQQEGGQNEN